jgi:hypothetical protein
MRSTRSFRALTSFTALFLAAALGAPALPARAVEPAAAERVDLDAVTRIRLEGFQRSKVMETASSLCDEIGPRVTGSPSYRKAAEWAKKQFAELGLENARIETFAPFGRGWTTERVSVRMLAPAVTQLPALPKAWAPGTGGPKKGPVVLARLEKDEDLASWKGKLEGKVLLVPPPVTAPGADARPGETAADKPDLSRYTVEELAKLSQFEPGGRGRAPRDRDRMRREYAFRSTLKKFLEDEKVLCTIDGSRGDYGTVWVQGGGSWKKEEGDGVPAVVLGAEAFGRIQRLLERKVPVELEVDVAASYTDEDPLAVSNVLAEIPGTDRKDEIVMLGAHLDSWHGGTGATDNAAGVAAVLEAVRILKAAGLKPRRTIRVGLWGGEEQGLLGSRAYVDRYLASRPEPADPKEKELPVFLRTTPRGPLTTKAAWSKLYAYFNLDNGGGKVRGIYTQENVAAGPIFAAWLAPFADLGATTVTNRNTGGTDHQSFDGVGVPGFQFIQDELDYMSRTHHTNMDVYERLPRADMMESSVLLAAFAWQAANRDGAFPRKPIPPDPVPATTPSPSVR